MSTPPVLVSCSTCGRAVVAASPAETNSADFQCFECWDAEREREQLAALELDREIEADEAAAMREHGTPDYGLS